MNIKLTNITCKDNVVYFNMNLLKDKVIELSVPLRFWRRDNKCTWMLKGDTVHVGEKLKLRLYMLLTKEGHL